jgi:large subunit ribosomal protein L23
VRGKKKRLGKFQGKQADWKKAIATLKAGDSIELYEGV